MHIGSGEDGDVGGDSETIEEMGEEPDGDKQQRRDGEAEVDGVDKRVEAVFTSSRAEGLGDQRIEPDEETFAEEGEDEKQAGADADGGDGLGAVGEAADHHGVHDGHTDPADFGEDERDDEVKSGAKLGAKSGPGEHRLVYEGRGRR